MINESINDIAVKTSNFIRSQVRKLELSDDDKLRVTMAATAVTASIFIDALSQLTGEPMDKIELEFKTALNGILTNRTKQHARN